LAVTSTQAARRLPRPQALPPLHLPKQPEHDSPRHFVLLQVDQQLSEGTSLRIAPEGADRVHSVEVRQSKDVDELGAGRQREASRRDLRAASISSKVTTRTLIPVGDSDRIQSAPWLDDIQLPAVTG
jgi:hypothetical protein